MERNRLNHGEKTDIDDVVNENLVLPAYKIYDTEHRLEDRVEPNSMEKYFSGRFLDFKDFDVKRVPNWNLDAQIERVGFRNHSRRIEGKKDWKQWISRQEQKNS